MTGANILPANLTDGTFASLSVMQRYVHLIDDGFGGNSAKLTLLSRVLQQVIKDSCVWVCMEALFDYAPLISKRSVRMIRTICS